MLNGLMLRSTLLNNADTCGEKTMGYTMGNISGRNYRFKWRILKLAKLTRINTRSLEFEQREAEGQMSLADTTGKIRANPYITAVTNLGASFRSSAKGGLV